jgi:probable F420-dependent oxidoreductase
MTVTADEVAAWRQRVGKVGVWFGGQGHGAVDAARRVEELGYRGLWIGGGNRDAQSFDSLAGLLGATRELVVATGIVDVWAWDPAVLDETVTAVVSRHPDRFILGLGISHPQMVEGYQRPIAKMRSFLDGLDEAAAARGGTPHFRVLAALRGKMLELSRDRAGGAHPYFTPPQHTATARAVLGPDRLLAPEQAVVVEADPARARAIARDYVRRYLALTNYVNNLRELGYGDDDFADCGSDRLVDAIIAWGTPEQIAGRIQEHLDAGADHVAIQPLTGDSADLGLDQLERLAPAVRV